MKKQKLTKWVIRLIWISLGVSVSATGLLFLLIWLDAFGWFGSIPSFEKLENPKVEHASLLYSSDQVLLGKYYRENRTIATYEDLSNELRETLLATEDRRFFEHSGIDLTGLLRAVLGTLSFNYQGGGSTLTMQLAENLYDTSTENKGSLYRYKYIGRIVTKFKEWIISVGLERHFTKKEILAMYLNTIPFGSNTFGINAATRTFFKKTPDELNYAESALLVGLINAPTRYSPILNPEKSVKKRNDVLYRIHKYDYISRHTYDSLCALPIQLQYEVDSHYRGRATYFRAVLKNKLMKWCEQRGYDLFGDGLRIYVTLDSRLQEHAEKALTNHMKQLQEKFEGHWLNQNPWIDANGNEIEGFLEQTIKRTEIYKKLIEKYGPETAEKPNEALWKALHQKRKMRVFSWSGERDTLFSYIDSLAYYKRFLHAGFLAQHPQSGAIKAWVGGINYKYFKFDHVMQGKRQPGSIIKPFVYTAVIDNGYSPCYEVIDQPVTFHMPNQYPGIWSPTNAEGPSSGRRMTIRQAMARSVNTITAYWMKKIGIETVVRYAKRIGIQSKLEAVPALCLGAGGDVSVFEMAGAYSTFANKGIWAEPFFIQRIEDKEGNVIQEFVPKKVEALSEETAYIMLHMLKGTIEERGGTSVGIPWSLKSNNDIGAKTGTTQNASDGWFVGLTQDLSACVWVGGEDRSIHFRNWVIGQGARTAMPIWIDFMEHVYKDSRLNIEKKRFTKPVRPLSVTLDCAQHFQDEPTEEQQTISSDDIF